MQKNTPILGIFLLVVAFSFTACEQVNSPGDSALTMNYNVGTGNSSGTVPTDTTNYSLGETVTILDNIGDLRGDLLISGIKQRFIGWNLVSGATTAQFVADDTLYITGNTTLYAVYTTGTDILRKVGPAGGLVFYDAGSDQSWGRYLECAPSSTQWSSQLWGGFTPLPQGAQVISVPDANKTAIGTGNQNTEAIINKLGSAHSAAKLCSDLESGGESDWYLPSSDELYEMCWVLHSKKYDGSSNSEDNPAYGSDRIGGFDNHAYWSSYQHNDFYVGSVNFDKGSTGNNYKSAYYHVRAVRSF